MFHVTTSSVAEESVDVFASLLNVQFSVNSQSSW